MKRSNINIMLRLIKLVKPLSLYMLAAIMMGVIGNLMASFITISAALMICTILNITNYSITMICIMMVIMAICRGLLRYGEQSCNHFIAFKLLALIRDQVFKALRKLCPAKLDGKQSGNLISIITTDIELLEVFYAHTISPIMIAIIYCLIMIIFISHYSISLAIIAILAYISVGIIMPIYISRSNKDLGMIFRNKQGELSGFILDSLRGLKEIIQYHLNDKRLNDMNNKTNDLLAYEEKMKDISANNSAITNVIVLLFDILMLTIASLLYLNNKISFISVIIPVITLMSSFGPVNALAALGSTLQNTFASANRVLDILDESPLVEEISGKEDILADDIKVDKVSFKYDEEIILDDLSLDIKANSITGIAGKSGSGKSTLLKLIMRFYECNNGHILINNTDVNEINTKNLRDMESYVTQDTYLFHDSIKNNIKIAKLDASDDEIITACKKASIHDFITSLANGYDTKVKELGDSLSGGQKQRIGLARAFLHDSNIVLLDEPTSNLDSLNEAIILKALKEESNGKTIVLVSHRQSTMGICDKVYSVENGRLS